MTAWCNIVFGNSSANPLSYAKKLYLNDELVTELVIPDGITAINNYAFYYLTSITSVTIPDSVTTIGSDAFYNCSNLKTVYYAGTAEEWVNIEIDSNNSNLIGATRYYYSETEPTGTGKYWHYDENGEIAVW